MAAKKKPKRNGKLCLSCGKVIRRRDGHASEHHPYCWDCCALESVRKILKAKKEQGTP